MPGINKIQTGNQGDNNFGVQMATSNGETENKENRVDTADLLVKEMRQIHEFIVGLQKELHLNGNNNNNNLSSSTSRNSWLG